jgi:hypothetical protein
VALWSRDGKSAIIDLGKIFMLEKTLISTVSFQYMLSHFPLFCLTCLYSSMKTLKS